MQFDVAVLVYANISANNTPQTKWSRKRIRCKNGGDIEIKAFQDEEVTEGEVEAVDGCFLG